MGDASTAGFFAVLCLDFFGKSLEERRRQFFRSCVDQTTTKPREFTANVGRNVEMKDRSVAICFKANNSATFGKACDAATVLRR
jgi:hypothetical protein